MNGFIGVKAFVEKLACAKAWLIRKRNHTQVHRGEPDRQAVHQGHGVQPTLLDYA
jgi:hypothetical protein